jgi:hypothetical protein
MINRERTRGVGSEDIGREGPGERKKEGREKQGGRKESERGRSRMAWRLDGSASQLHRGMLTQQVR